ncbi:sialic acid-binding Ig-like lectin 10 isoform X2 [Arvicanthis niloticus]|uniref:sialic acid-binding Ig-like lectin 10 isoform X2 n=1 Tax=Arvicanthis niloticus TaxID=61156 RepID=UPI001485EA01|nr:sialic acid-binding Ig-like lectin 10 isoform X2 [Arvicanthis niloticus]
MSLLLFLLSLLLDGSQGQMERYFLQVQRIVKAQEGLCIFVPCSFSSPEEHWNNRYPAYGYWFKETSTNRQSFTFPVATNNKNKKLDLGVQGRFQLLGDPTQRDCSLLIKDVQWTDKTSYFFRMEKGHEKYSFKEGFMLQVEGLTQKPDVFIPEILEPGKPVTIVCLFSWTFKQCPAPSFSWTGDAVSFQETRPHTSDYSVLSFTPGLQHHDTELTCHLDFSRKSMQRTVQLRVAHAPRSLAINIFRDNVSVPELHGNPSHLEVQQGHSLRLLCTADSQPPATLSWVLEDRVLSWSSPVGSRTLALELPWVKAGDSGHYICQAENRLGSQQHTLDLSVLLLEILSNGTSLPVLEGQSLCLVCVTYSNPPASVSWAWVTQTLIPTQSSEPGVLELPLVQREHEGEFTCAAQNPLGAQRISLSLSVHYPPQMSRPSCSWENEGLHCSCSSRAWPAPSLRWRLGEGLLEGNSTNASFKITSSSLGPWVNSSLSLLQELGPSLWLSCESWNTHGAQTTSVLLLPDKDTSTAFSKGAVLGFGITVLLALCLIVIIMKTLRRKGIQEETSRPKLSRGSTILDYINVIPKTRSLARNWKAEPDTPSGISPLDTHFPKPKKKQKDPQFTSPGCLDPTSSSQTPVSENNPEELHYAALNFSRLRLREIQNPQDTYSEYAEVRVH